MMPSGTKPAFLIDTTRRKFKITGLTYGGEIIVVYVNIIRSNIRVCVFVCELVLLFVKVWMNQSSVIAEENFKEKFLC